MRNVLRRIWYALRPGTIRRVVAGIMLIIAGGRLGLYSSRPLADILSTSTYGILLLIIGLALYVGHDWHYTLVGRSVAAAGALLLATMAWDGASVSLGVTVLVEVWLALLLLFSVFSESNCV